MLKKLLLAGGFTQTIGMQTAAFPIYSLQTGESSTCDKYESRFNVLEVVKCIYVFLCFHGKQKKCDLTLKSLKNILPVLEQLGAFCVYLSEVRFK